MDTKIYKIVSNKQLTPSIYEMKLEGDTSMISAPGQFLNIKLDGFYLRRPISICDWNEKEITIIYKTVGQGTKHMATLEVGTELDILCSLGNGYDLTKIPANPVLAGGGVGVPPMYGLAKALVKAGKKPAVVLGFNTKEEVFYEEEFKALGVDVKVATADGSYGIKGFVTEGFEAGEYVCACGPEPMLKAISDKAQMVSSASKREWLVALVLAWVALAKQNTDTRESAKTVL
jgi:dihydroorotate dehydrogenase electron transfer subunit